MAKLHYVKAARKAIPGTGVKKGSAYYWYQKKLNGRGGKKVCSLRKPKRSSYSTSSPFIAAMMDFEDSLGEQGFNDGDEARSYLIDLADDVRALGLESEATADSVAQAFPNGCPTQELLRERATACETIAEALSNAADTLSEESTEDEINAAITEVAWEYE